MPESQKRAPDLIADGCEPPWGCWELNSGSLEELAVLVNSEPSLFFFKREIICMSFFFLLFLARVAVAENGLGYRGPDQAWIHALRGSGVRPQWCPEHSYFLVPYKTSLSDNHIPTLSWHWSVSRPAGEPGGLHHRLPVLCRSWDHLPNPYNQLTWYSLAPDQPRNLIWPLYYIQWSRRYLCLATFPLDQIPKSFFPFICKRCSLSNFYINDTMVCA